MRRDNELLPAAIEALEEEERREWEDRTVKPLGLARRSDARAAAEIERLAGLARQTV
ncbi:MAG TPA: hypothetical protein VK973_10515 [Arenicellales bacterium]|nr:hypothetical protein [Arenicellales bacterium]